MHRGPVPKGRYPVKAERSHWRDEAISARHREWGFDCPAVDVDFLAVEYNAGMPVALVEYKVVGTPVDLKQPSLKAIATLANKAKVPFFLAWYSRDGWWFDVQPMTQLTGKYVPARKIFTEREWVCLLYALRGLKTPIPVWERLSNYRPPESRNAEGHACQ